MGGHCTTEVVGRSRTLKNAATHTHTRVYTHTQPNTQCPEACDIGELVCVCVRQRGILVDLYVYSCVFLLEYVCVCV